MRLVMKNRLSAFLVVALGTATAAVAQPVAVDLSTLGGTFSVAYAVNGSDQVIRDSRVFVDAWRRDGRPRHARRHRERRSRRERQWTRGGFEFH